MSHYKGQIEKDEMLDVYSCLLEPLWMNDHCKRNTVKYSGHWCGTREDTLTIQLEKRPSTLQPLKGALKPGIKLK